MQQKHFLHLQFFSKLFSLHEGKAFSLFFYIIFIIFALPAAKWWVEEKQWFTCVCLTLEWNAKAAPKMMMMMMKSKLWCCMSNVVCCRWCDGFSFLMLQLFSRTSGIGGGTYQLPTTEAEGCLIKRKCAKARNLCANIAASCCLLLFSCF